jgi:quercetin dioxygenase-like cupin family protein
MDPRRGGSYVITGQDGDRLQLPGGVGVQFKVDGEWTAGAVAVVEHPVAPGAFAGPHTHSKEDEISYVLEGRIAAEIDEREVTIEAGEYLFKPRGLKHAFWNPTDRPARLIEIIAPAGLERFFRTMSTLRPVPGSADPERAIGLMAEFGVVADFDDLDAFLARHGLHMPEMAAAEARP